MINYYADIIANKMGKISDSLEKQNELLAAIADELNEMNRIARENNHRGLDEENEG